MDDNYNHIDKSDKEIIREIYRQDMAMYRRNWLVWVWGLSVSFISTLILTVSFYKVGYFGRIMSMDFLVATLDMFVGGVRGRLLLW